MIKISDLMRFHFKNLQDKNENYMWEENYKSCINLNKLLNFIFFESPILFLRNMFYFELNASKELKQFFLNK